MSSGKNRATSSRLSPSICILTTPGAVKILPFGMVHENLCRKTESRYQICRSEGEIARTGATLDTKESGLQVPPWRVCASMLRRTYSSLQCD